MNTPDLPLVLRRMRRQHYLHYALQAALMAGLVLAPGPPRGRHRPPHPPRGALARRRSSPC